MVWWASLFSEMELSLLGSFVPRAGVGALHSSADEHFQIKESLLENLPLPKVTWRGIVLILSDELEGWSFLVWRLNGGRGSF